MNETARTNSVGDRLCIEIARATIAKVAADEVGLFDDVANARNSVPVIEGDALAFGVGDEILFLTPMVLKVVEESVRYVAPKLFATALDIGKDTVKDAIHKKLQDHANADSAKPASQVTESFSREQLKTIHDVAMAQLARSGLADDMAMTVASVIVGELAIA